MEIVTLAIVVAAALVIEFLTYQIVTIWCVIAALASMVLAACGFGFDIQIIVFFTASVVLFLLLRPIIKRFTKTDTVHTNADAIIGHITKLTSGIKEGRGTIIVNAVTWTVVCDQELGSGTAVEITAIDGNKYIVKKAEGK